MRSDVMDESNNEVLRMFGQLVLNEQSGQIMQNHRIQNPKQRACKHFSDSTQTLQPYANVKEMLNGIPFQEGFVSRAVLVMTAFIGDGP